MARKPPRHALSHSFQLLSLPNSKRLRDHSHNSSTRKSVLAKSDSANCALSKFTTTHASKDQSPQHQTRFREHDVCSGSFLFLYKLCLWLRNGPVYRSRIEMTKKAELYQTSNPGIMQSRLVGEFREIFCSLHRAGQIEVASILNAKCNGMQPSATECN